ncbi:uncharacterized protein LOC142026649 isoform X2 [Buteo buteo]|uniref:uncharacterized protein LOC142026649 isoform X2 n=1 Tax=Buteo buteo TaxID=30397 RepID=UPI003EBBD64E
MSVNEAQLGTLAKQMWKMSASMGAKEEPPEGATAVEGTDNGTDREKRKTSILEIVAAYESERNEKLVDVRCCADIPPCFIPPLSTQVLASGMQIYPRGAITLSRAIAGPGDCRYCSAPRSSTVGRAGVWSQSCHGATMISLRRREESWPISCITFSNFLNYSPASYYLRGCLLPLSLQIQPAEAQQH